MAALSVTADGESVRVMPANGAGPSRAEALAAAIDGARAALEQHLRDFPYAQSHKLGRETPAADQPLLTAYRQLIAAGKLMQSRRATRPAPQTETASESDAVLRASINLDTPDDLTRIRGLDATFASRLASIGITNFAQIAAWQPEDVPTIAQALDLGRDFVRHDVIEQARMLLVARPARRDTTLPADGRSASSVAAWLPHAREHVVPAAIMPTAMTVDEFEALIRHLRRGVGRHHLRALADIAPALAAAIPVPDIYFDPFETEAEWRPCPLVVLPTVADDNDAKHAVAIVVVDTHIPLAPQPKPGLSAEHARLAEAQPSPLYLAAGARLDELEAEIALLGEPPAVALDRSAQPTVNTVSDAATVVSGTALQPATTAIVTIVRAALPVVESEEADVTITVHRGKPSPFAAMPELPLRPKRMAQTDDAVASKLVPNSEVSEAAVVIVKRRAAERAAPDLEFYRVPAGGGEAGPVRRLLRAVKVL